MPALEKGGRDNVSVVVVAYDGAGGRWPARLSEGATNWLAVLGGIVLAVLIAAAAVWIGRKR